MTALDIQCPLNASSAGPTAAPSTCPSEKSLGSMNRLSTSTDASTYSEEYSGSDIATHSPQPADSPDGPSSTARSSRMSRVVSTPNEVRNGATSGIEIRRSSTPVSFIEHLLLAKPRTSRSGRIRSPAPPFSSGDSTSRSAVRHAPASAGSDSRIASMSAGTPTRRVRTPDPQAGATPVGTSPGTGAPSAPADSATAAPRSRSAANDAACPRPAHASAVRSDSRSQCTSIRSVSVPPLMTSSIVP